VDHLSESDVEGFLNGSLAPDDRKRVVRHLVSGCALCGSQIFAGVPEGMFLPPGPRTEDSAYDAAIDRAFRTARRLERRWEEDQDRLSRGLAWVREKNGLLSELTPPQARTILPWIRVLILLQLSFEIRHRDPVRMLDLARHAQEEADRIEKTPYGPGFLDDLRVRAWAELANALRVNELYRQAEAAVWQARMLLAQGSGDLLLQARIDDVEGSLRNAQHRYGEASALMDAAHQTYLKLGERHLAGRVLINKGLCLRLAGRPLDAVGVLRRSLELLETSLDPKLAASARQNLMDALVDSGRLAEAGQVLLESDLRQAFAEDPQSLLRLRWVEAKLLARRGRLADATRVLSEVRAGFRSHGLEYVAAVAGADEAALLLRQGLKKEAHGLALDLRRTFSRLGIHEEAERALQFLEIACRGRVATPELAERVGRFLDRAAHDRRLRFEPENLLRG
jgi:tetratricopeptide (TPR) repeat protein